MTDPFDALRITDTPLDPRPEFASELRDTLATALETTMTDTTAAAVATATGPNRSRSRARVRILLPSDSRARSAPRHGAATAPIIGRAGARLDPRRISRRPCSFDGRGWVGGGDDDDGS